MILPCLSSDTLPSLDYSNPVYLVTQRRIPVELRAFHFYDLMALLNNPMHRTLLTQLYIDLSALIAKQLGEVSRKCHEHVTKKLHQNVAGELIRLVSNNEASGVSHEINGTSHEDLARILGVYRETITEIITDFREAGILTTSKLCIKILEPVQLAEIANGNARVLNRKRRKASSVTATPQ